MADVKSNRAEMKKAFLKSLQSHEGDSMAYTKDYFEKYKHGGYWEMQGGRLKFYEKDKPENNTITTVVEVEKRRGTNILILRCGPGGRMVLFLEFDSKKDTDEWQEALCKSIGQEHAPHPALRKWESERRKRAVRKKRRARFQSALPDLLISKQADSDSAPSEAPPRAASEAASEAPPKAPSEVPSEALSEAPPEAPSKAPFEAPPAEQMDVLQGVLGETDDSCDSQNISPPQSLHSHGAAIGPTLEDMAKISVKKECSIEDLKQLKIMDYKGDVEVNEPLSNVTSRLWLHVGDIIVVRNNKGLRMNAIELTEYIRTTTEHTVTLTIKRGAVCTVRKEEQELVISIKGSQTVSLNMVDAIMKACTSLCSLLNGDTKEDSNLTITEINNQNLDITSEPNQIAEKLRKALETSVGYVTLRLVPQSLLNAVK